MESRDCSIGLDLGTTNAKAVAFDESGHRLCVTDVPVATLHDEAGEAGEAGAAGAAEQDPAAIAEAATLALAGTASAARDQGYHVARVGISAAMHSILPVAANETPLGRALIWMDVRASAEADALWATAEGRRIYQNTGTPVHAMAPLAKLLWLRAHRPALFQWAARFVSLKEWVWHRWFGEWAVDASLASATGLYNLHTGQWDAEALRVAGIDAARLSRLVPTTYTRRDVRERALLDAGITPETDFVIGASDGVLANLGAGVLTADQMVLTIGTSLAIRTTVTSPVTDEATRSFCYWLDAGRYVVGGPSNNGGIVLDWLAHQILGGQDATGDALAALVAAAEHARPGDLLFLPYVAGERAPLWQGVASGVLLGLRVEHTRADVLRAAVEGIIFNAYAIAAPLMERVGRPRAIIASGKVLEAAWIRQLVADVFGIPVRMEGGADASAAGAAALASIATGQRTWDDLARRQPDDDITAAAQLTQPASSGAYAAKIQRFQRLAAALTGELAEVYLPRGTAGSAP